MGVELTLRGLDDYPGIGARLSLRALSHAGSQLRLAVE
jgi:hypothetical protein